VSSGLGESAARQTAVGPSKSSIARWDHSGPRHLGQPEKGPSRRKRSYGTENPEHQQGLGPQGQQRNQGRCTSRNVSMYSQPKCMPDTGRHIHISEAGDGAHKGNTYGKGNDAAEEEHGGFHSAARPSTDSSLEGEAAAVVEAQGPTGDRRYSRSSQPEYPIPQNEANGDSRANTTFSERETISQSKRKTRRNGYTEPCESGHRASPTHWVQDPVHHSTPHIARRNQRNSKPCRLTGHR